MRNLLVTATRGLGRQGRLDPAADVVQRAVTSVYDAAGPAGQRLKNVLHGTWLGHPLHPVLTDAPIGFWLASLALDALEAAGNEEVGPGADAALALGLAAAVPTALAGATDWQHTDGRARRIGVVHGLLNVGGLALYAVSLGLRRGGARGAGRGVAALAFGVLNVSAYLGGHLVYAEQVGVDHTGGQEAPEDWTPVLTAAELPESSPRRVEADGTGVLLVRRGARIHALAETCAHFGGPLAEGALEDGSIRCPWHGSRYALEDGQVLDGPSAFPQPCYETRIRDGQIEVRRSAAGSGG